MTIWNHKEKSAHQHAYYLPQTNLIYKHLVEAVWEEDPEKIQVHKRC
jgi:hypothetical protein